MRMPAHHPDRDARIYRKMPASRSTQRRCSSIIVRRTWREAVKTQDLIAQSFGRLVAEGRQILQQAGWDGRF